MPIASRPEDEGKEWYHSHAAMVLLPLTVLLLLFVLNHVVGPPVGDRIAASDGLGFDGINFARIAKDFRRVTFKEGLDNYYIGRIGPSGVVYVALSLLGVERSNEHIVLAFALLNIALVTVLVYVWCLIARELRISTLGKWLGVTALVVNCAILKMSSYYAVLTDTSAYLLGLLMLHYYLAGNRLAVTLTTLVSSFCWPICLHVGVLFLLFPRRRLEATAIKAASRSLALLAAACAALLVPVAVVLVANGFGERYSLVLVDFVQPTWPVIHLSVTLAMLYLGAGVYFLVRWSGIGDLRRLLSSLRLGNILLAGALLIGVPLLHNKLAVSRHPMNTVRVVLLTFWSSVLDPAYFLVAHAAYFGPLCLLAVRHWKSICRLLQEIGPGLTLAAAYGLVWSLYAESRCLSNLYPLFVPLVVCVLDRSGWTARQFWLFVAVSYLYSKVWLTIGGDWGLYFMNFGLYMNHLAYAIQGTCVVLGGLLLFRSTGQSEARSLPEPAPSFDTKAAA